MTFPSANSKSASPTRSCASSVRRHPSAARWRISQSPLGSTRRNVLSPCVPFGFVPGCTWTPCVCRFVVCEPCGTFAGLARQLVSTSVAGMWCRISSRCSSTRVGGVEQSPPWAFEMAQRAALEIVRRNLERVRRWPFRHLPVIRAEHVSQLHAQNGITPRANRRTRTGAVEAEERREPVARRDRPRDVPVSNDLQRQRLSRPLLRTPYPRLRPVLDAHRRWIRERIRRGRLRRCAVPVPIRASAGLRSRASRGPHLSPRAPRPNLQQFATRQQARLARLVVLFHLDVSGEVGWTVTENRPSSAGESQLLDFNPMLRRVAAFTFLGLLIAAAPARAFVGQVIDARRRTPIANAEVTVVGHRGSVRTGPDGRFEWSQRAAPPLVFVVILQDGVVCRPIQFATLDEASGVTLVVRRGDCGVDGRQRHRAGHRGFRRRLHVARERRGHHSSASGDAGRDPREHSGGQRHLRRPVGDAGDSRPGSRPDVHHGRRQPCVERAARRSQRLLSRPGHRRTGGGRSRSRVGRIWL